MCRKELASKIMKAAASMLPCVSNFHLLPFRAQNPPKRFNFFLNLGSMTLYLSVIYSVGLSIKDGAGSTSILRHGLKGITVLLSYIPNPKLSEPDARK